MEWFFLAYSATKPTCCWKLGVVTKRVQTAVFAMQSSVINGWCTGWRNVTFTNVICQSHVLVYDTFGFPEGLRFVYIPRLMKSWRTGDVVTWLWISQATSSCILQGFATLHAWQSEMICSPKWDLQAPLPKFRKNEILWKGLLRYRQSCKLYNVTH